MTESLRLVVCDDRQARRAQWIEDLTDVGALRTMEAVPVDFDTFTRDINRLRRRRTKARPDHADGEDLSGVDLSDLGADPDVNDESERTVFDTADVLIVDYALEEFEGEEDYLTGALVAYLARCYSRCGVIVGVNQQGENPFDLTLTGDRTSFADVDIGQKQLANPGLWGPSEGGFRPWSWPIVPDLVERYDQRIRVAADHLEDSALEVLGLKAIMSALPRGALQALELAHRAPEDVTVEDVARHAELGLRRGDYPMSRPAVARIAAARIGKWLELALLPLQDVLVDAPHLATRNSRLLAGPPDRESSWQETCRVAVPHDEAGLIAGLSRHRYQNDVWTTRPTWLWPSIRTDESLPGVADPWTIPETDLVFCEDLSRFVDRSDARRFVMEVGSNTTRWISNPTKVDNGQLQEVEYQPLRRLAV